MGVKFSKRKTWHGFQWSTIIMWTAILRKYWCMYTLGRSKIAGLLRLVGEAGRLLQIRIVKAGSRFSTSSACSIFLKFSQYCFETSIIQIHQRKKEKKYFLRRNFQNKHFTIAIADQYLVVKLILGYIFENKTQKQKRQVFFDKIWSIRTKYFI